MKRIISFVLTVALLFGLVGTTGFQAFATEDAPELLERVILTDLPEYILAGAVTTPTAAVELGECSVTAVQWVDLDKNPVTAFEAGRKYWLAITLETQTHAFGEFLETYEWGNNVNYQEAYEIVSEQKAVVYYCYTVVPATYGFTEYVGISFPDYYPGDPIPEVPQVTAEGGTITEICWTGDEYGEPFSDTHFQAGGTYQFRVTIVAPEGYPYLQSAYDSNHLDGDWQSSSYDFAEDLTSIVLYVCLEPRYDTVGSATVVGVPWEIEAGPAVAPTLEAERDSIVIENVYWVDMDLNPVTTLEEGKAYYLAVEVASGKNYIFTEYTDLYSDGRAVALIELKNENQMVGYIFYSLEENVGTIKVDMSGLAEGVSVADFTPVVSGNAVVESVEVFNTTTGQTVTDGVFEPNSSYRLNVTLSAKENCQFDNPTLEVYPNSTSSYSYSTYSLQFFYVFSTSQIVDVVEIVVDPPVPGGNVSDAVPAADPDAPYTITDYLWRDADDWSQAGETFDGSNGYDLWVTVTPKPGYAFEKSQTTAYINGVDEYWTRLDPDGEAITIMGNFAFDLKVDNVWLENLPYQIEAGTAKVPTLTEDYGQVTISKVQWVNTSKSKVTSFKDGKVYFLEVTLKAADGKTFNTQQDPREFVGSEYSIVEWKYKSDTELVLYYRYSLEPSVGKVIITPPAMAVGMDVSQLVPTVTGNVTLTDIQVDDLYDHEAVTGQLEAGKNYHITYTFAPKSGYRMQGLQVTVDTDYNNEWWQYGSQDLTVEVYFSTCQKISQVELTLDGVEVGKNIVQVQAVTPEGAPYTASIHWYDAEEGGTVSGTFQDLKKYQAWIYLDPADGYAFDQQVQVTVNGETWTEKVSGAGNYMDIMEYFSFLRPIEKAEFPAMPASITKGQTLPTDFTVPEDAPYTVYAEWGIVNSGTVTKADKNGSYMLYLQLNAKDGYEFTDDTVVYVGGKETLNYIPGGDTDISAYGVYNIGVTEIDRVDITVPAPTTGAKPGEATVSSKAKYTLEDVDWGCNADGSLLDIQDVTTFEKDDYIFISPTLKAKDGYAFAADVEVYVNGVKLDTVRSVNAGIYLHSYHLLGQVIDQPTKLEAPQVTVSGNTLTWEDNGAASYEIYRATSKSGKYTLLETVTGEAAAAYALRAADIVTYEDASAVAGKTYYYKVKAISAAGSKYSSDLSTASSVAYEFQAPAISAGINGVSGKPVITWEKISGAKSYDVYRATEENGTYTKLGNTTSDTYVDTKAAVGTVYYYKVVTVGSSSAYNSEDSRTVTGYAVLEQPAVKSAVDKATGKPSLSWGKIDGAVEYRIYRQLGEAEFMLIQTQTEQSFIDTTAPLDTVCTYYVQAAASQEKYDSVISETVTETVALGVPALQGGVDAFGNPRFNWQPVEGAVKYEVYRSTKSNKGFALIAVVEDGNACCDESAVAGTTYYYKVIALGQVSKSEESAVLKLTGTCATPTVESTINTAGKPSLSWNKIDDAKKGYEIYRSVDGGKFKKLKTVKTTSYVDTSAPIGSSCTYQVRALAAKAAGNSPWSEPTTQMVICSAVTVKAAVDTVTGQPSLSWSKTTGAAGYRIYRQLPGEETFTQVGEVTGTSFKDTTAPIDTLCLYKVVTLGKTEELNSNPSEEISVASGLERPALTGSVDAFGNPTVQWQPVEGAVKYEVYRSTKSNKGFALIAVVEDGNACCDESAVAGTTYYYKVIALGQVSKSEESAVLKLTGTCATPTVESTINTAGKPSLSWNKIDDAKKGYEIYRSVDGGKFKKLKTVKTTSYVDTSAPIGSSCTYQVRALAAKAAGNSPWSEPTTQMVICSAVTVKAAVDTVTGQPSLSWSKTTGAAGYRIYRQLPGEETFTQVGEVTGTSFKDTTAPIDTLCLYKVVTLGKTEELNSNPSEEISVTSGMAQPSFKGSIDPVTGNFILTWDAVEGAVKYEILRSTNAKKGFISMGFVEGLRYEETSAPGKTYYYKVVAVGEVGRSTEPAGLKLVGKCAQPVATADTDLTGGKPVITWEAVSGAKKYEIWRATSEDGKYTKVGTSTKLTYTDTKATPGNTYYYKVVAAGSKSAYNSEKSKATQAVDAIAAQPVITLKTDAKTGKLSVSWKKVSGATQYKVMYVDITDYILDGAEPTEEELLAHMQEVVTTKTSYTFTEGERGRVYLITVVAAPKNTDYCSIPSEFGYGAVACAAPKIKATTYEGYPAATWNEVDDAECYYVYRSTKSNKDFELLGYVEDLGFIDGSAVKGKTYYYKITAVTGLSESAFSNTVKIKRK